MHEMTVTVLAASCGRQIELRKAVEALRTHAASLEPEVRLLWLLHDDGIRTPELQLGQGAPWDEIILSKGNSGLGPALNCLLSHVRTPYFLLLPDDWLLDNPQKAPFIQKALAILECDGRIGNVNLDGQYFLEFNDRLLYAGPFRTPVGDPEYFVRNPALPWAGFHLSPMIGRTAAFHDIGPFREDQPLQRRWAELDYARRFGERWVAAKSPALSLFQHVGHEPCPGWLIHSGPGQNDLSNSSQVSSNETVAVVIPTYGQFDYAQRACESFLKTTPNGLALIVDDASAEWDEAGWVPLLKEVGDKRLFLHHFPTRGGVTRSWNWGLAKARAMGATYAVATNSDVLFAKGWFDGMRHALEHGWDYVGPLTNAPGPPNFAFQDVRFYNRCYAPQDTETALSETQCELRRRYPPDMVITAMVNGFCQVAKTTTWWKHAYDAEHVFDPAFPMVGNEEEFQGRLRAKGGKTGVACTSFVFHYRSVTRQAATEVRSS